MAERYPDDAVLQAIKQDEHTGVEYIETGVSPYYVEYRRMMQRLLLAAGRAGDFRVYQDGDLSFGVRDGRGEIAGQAVEIAAGSSHPVASDATTTVWLDASGMVQSGTGGFPVDRTMILPLAEITAGESSITSISDLRGETFLSRQRSLIDYQVLHEGDLTASIDSRLVGVAIAEGVIADVILTVGGNMLSNVAADGLAVSVEVNGLEVTAVRPSIIAGNGAGFRSTAQGDGVAAIIKSDGSELVSQGDLITVAVSREVNGAVGSEASDIAVVVIMHAV